MQDLTPVGLSEDGTRLVLVSSSGEEFAVPVDTRLRAALRGDNARLGQLETKMESALRPRDIQARIRAGESPEDVAAAAQTTVEAIMPFAGPVIAERQHVAQSALKGSLRRRTGETTTAARTLGEAAELYFSEHSLHDEDVEWDAWRRPDGRWALVAAYAVGGRPRTAEFTHDLPGRYVVADNDEARILTGELRAPERGRRAARAAAAPAEPGADPGRAAARRRRDRAGPRPRRGRRRGRPADAPTRRPTPPTPTGSPTPPSADARRRAADRGAGRRATPAAEEPARGARAEDGRDRGDEEPTRPRDEDDAARRSRPRRSARAARRCRRGTRSCSAAAPRTTDPPSRRRDRRPRRA